MPTHTIAARVDHDADDRAFLVRAPAVGVADGVPAEGVYLNQMEGFLTLRILNRRYQVLLPMGTQGRVTERFIEDTATPVEYNQPLFRLSLVQESEAGREAAGRGDPAARGDGDLIPVTAPSDGVFYRKPGPDSPPYVDVGDTISSGSVLGLVEVMKSFNQIRYGGPGLPDSGRVERVLVEDAAEVAFGQRLFLIKPR